MAWIHVLTIENCFDKPVELVLEPWATTYTMAPKARLDICSDRKPEGPLKVLHEPEGITIHAWENCHDLEVFENGVWVEPG